MIPWYDPDGNPYPGDSLEQMMAIERDAYDNAKRIVKQETLWNGINISTVWVPLLAQNFWIEGEDRPFVYETAIFFPPELMAVDIGVEILERYKSRAEAFAGHQHYASVWSSLKFTLKLWWIELRQHAFGDQDEAGQIEDSIGNDDIDEDGGGIEPVSW